MKIVKFSFGTSHQRYKDHEEAIKELIDDDYYPFVSLAKEVITSRKGETFLKCPANTDFLRNTYGFVAPHDLTINLTVFYPNASVHCPNITQQIFDTLIDTRFLTPSERGISQHPLIGVDWLNTFTTDEPMLMQMLPAFMHYNDFTSKATVIPGEYDISKWTRSAELVFEVKKQVESIEIKKGDVLAYFKFHSDDIVKLEQQPVPWPETVVCADIVERDRFRPLKERYTSLEEVRKCPYDPTNK
jgi:hypothetical protein